MNFRDYKGKLRGLRKTADGYNPNDPLQRQYEADSYNATDPLEQQFATPAQQNPSDSYLEAHHGPWRAVWNGGRLADVYHAESDTPVECINAGDYDWEKSGPFSGPAWHGGPPTQEGLTQRLQEWANEYGGETEQNVLPYQ